MKATIRLTKGFDKLQTDLNKVYLTSYETCKKAVYEGAGPVADKFRTNLSSVPTDSASIQKLEYTYGSRYCDGPVDGLTESQKKSLLESMGISGFWEDHIDHIDKKIGVEGYNDTITKSYPKGQPNAMILRSIEKGTEWHKKHPVIRPTANQMRNKVKKIMEETIVKDIKGKLN